MICCDIKMSSCGRCKQDTLVHIDREKAYETGFGCITCATAKAYKFTCTWEKCKKEFTRYYTYESQATNLWSKYCDKHMIEHIENIREYINPYPEMIPESMKEERKKYANDMLQSHRQGELSREFLEAHPQRAKQMLRDGAITKEEIKKSRYVWGKDVPGVTKKLDAEALIK